MGLGLTLDCSLRHWQLVAERQCQILEPLPVPSQPAKTSNPSIRHSRLSTAPLHDAVVAHHPAKACLGGRVQTQKKRVTSRRVAGGPYHEQIKHTGAWMTVGREFSQGN